MKLFSRKALVAGATAIAVSFAGVNVASAQSSTEQTTTSSSAAPTTTEENDSEDTTTTPESGSSADPDAIKDWIGVISAVVGALSTIYAFLNRING